MTHDSQSFSSSCLHPKHVTCRLVFQMCTSGYTSPPYILKLSVIASLCLKPLIPSVFCMKGVLSSWSSRFKTTDSCMTSFSSLLPTSILFFQCVLCPVVSLFIFIANICFTLSSFFTRLSKQSSSLQSLILGGQLSSDTNIVTSFF